MANREGTALSDEAMRELCFEGKPVPLGRLDLLLPPPQNTSNVYYKSTGKNPRMERPINVAAQVSNLSSASKIPKESLFKAYTETLSNKPDVKIGINPKRYYGRGTSSYTPDLTDEIYETLLNAQVYREKTTLEKIREARAEAGRLDTEIQRFLGQAAQEVGLQPEPPEGGRPPPTFLTLTRPLIGEEPRYSQFYPLVGTERQFGFATSAMTETERRQAESSRTPMIPVEQRYTGAVGGQGTPVVIDPNPTERLLSLVEARRTGSSLIN